MMVCARQVEQIKKGVWSLRHNLKNKFEKNKIKQMAKQNGTKHETWFHMMAT